MSDKATARPWKGDKYGGILDERGQPVACVNSDEGDFRDSREENEANLHLIVRAVNNAERLAEALRAVLVNIGQNSSKNQPEEWHQLAETVANVTTSMRRT